MICTDPKVIFSTNAERVWNNLVNVLPICDHSVCLFVFVCLLVPTGVAPDFLLVGGERVWQFRWNHSRLEPAAPAVSEP